MTIPPRKTLKRKLKKEGGKSHIFWKEIECQDQEGEHWTLMTRHKGNNSENENSFMYVGI
jgi:hypothetical protein